MNSAIKPNQLVEDVDELEYHVSEMVSKDGNFIPPSKARTTNKPSHRPQDGVQATHKRGYHPH